MAARLLFSFFVGSFADRLREASHTSSAAGKQRSKVYKKPSHIVPLTSVYNYESEGGSPNLRVRPSSLLETGALHTKASVVHASQLEVLRIPLSAVVRTAVRACRTRYRRFPLIRFLHLLEERISTARQFLNTEIRRNPSPVRKSGLRGVDA